MLPGNQELIDFCDAIAEHRGWDLVPTRRSLAACRAEASALDDGSGSPASEVAALLVAFALDERRLGAQARAVLPIMIAVRHMLDLGFNLAPEQYGELLDLQDRIAEQGVETFGAVRAWFAERLVSWR